MRVLLIGGTGLISTGIVKSLLGRGADVTMFNRGQRGNPLPGDVKTIVGDRNDFAVFERRFADERFDAVIDMICYKPEQAESDVRAFGGRTAHLLFCSTVCTYGVKIPPGVVVDESFKQEPISGYGRDKVACEKIVLGAQANGAFAVTIVRPSHTYGPGHPLIDMLQADTPSWSRVARGEPVIIADGGMGLWNSTHRDDCGKVFALAARNPAAYGKAYNATTQRVFTWRDYYREVGEALGKPTKIISMPAEWIVARDPKKYGLLAEITRFHGPYTSAAAMHDLPGFTCDIDFRDGVRETFANEPARDQIARGPDAAYEAMVADALAAGGTVVEA